MKIAITSDLHYPITSKETLEQFAISIAEQHHPDCICLLGDIGESRMNIDNFRKCCDIFKSILQIPMIVLPGNHDLWCDTLQCNSMDLLNTVLPDQAKSIPAHWLENENVIINRIAFVGSYLHYDYSARDKVGVTAMYPEEFIESNRNSVINDGLMRGQPRDKEFAATLGKEFDKRLLVAQNDPTVNDIVVLTHVPCMECQITRNPYDVKWSLSTPYFGNLSHEKLITSCNKVRLVVSGHSHRGNYNKEGNIDVYNLSCDYKNPVVLLYDIEEKS